MMHLTASLSLHLSASLSNRNHQELVHYELPIIEEPGKPPVAENYEKLSYVHRYTGRRTEFTRPRVVSDVTPDHLAEIRAEWEAKVTRAPRRHEHDCRIGFITLPRRNAEIVAEWKRLARDPHCIAWPGRAEYAYHNPTPLKPEKRSDDVVPFGRDAIEWGQPR